MSGLVWLNLDDNDAAVDGADVSPWDTLYLGGVVWPGIWQVGLSKKRSLDIIKVRRLDGTRTLDNGYFGAEIRAQGRIWTREQFDSLQAILPYFDPQRRGGGRSPLDISHPAAALLGVHQVYIGQIEVPPAQPGVLLFGLDMVEWCADYKPYIQGFAGTRQANKPLNAQDFNVDAPSGNTGDKL